jgi:cell shape-determining protein MreC
MDFSAPTVIILLTLLLCFASLLAGLVLSFLWSRNKATKTLSNFKIEYETERSRLETEVDSLKTQLTDKKQQAEERER